MRNVWAGTGTGYCRNKARQYPVLLCGQSSRKPCDFIVFSMGEENLLNLQHSYWRIAKSGSNSLWWRSLLRNSRLVPRRPAPPHGGAAKRSCGFVTIEMTRWIYMAWLRGWGSMTPRSLHPVFVDHHFSNKKDVQQRASFLFS